MEELLKILYDENLSLLIKNNDKTYKYKSRGVADLYNIIKSEENILMNSSVADKIVGKGAAALMIKGGVKELITTTVSVNALELIKDSDMKITYLKQVPFIENRDKTGWCPVEKLCKEDYDIDTIIKKIDNFINKT